MGVPSFFKTRGPNKFNYSPLYWDPVKEAREERIRSIKHEMGIDTDSNLKGASLSRGSFRQFKRNTKVRASRSSNIRLAVILAILFLISYLIFFR